MTTQAQIQKGVPQGSRIGVLTDPAQEMSSCGACDLFFSTALPVMQEKSQQVICWREAQPWARAYLTSPGVATASQLSRMLAIGFGILPWRRFRVLQSAP